MYRANPVTQSLVVNKLGAAKGRGCSPSDDAVPGSLPFPAAGWLSSPLIPFLRLNVANAASRGQWDDIGPYGALPPTQSAGNPRKTAIFREICRLRSRFVRLFSGDGPLSVRRFGALIRLMLLRQPAGQF